MERSRREDETREIGRHPGREWHFRAVRTAVSQRQHGDESEVDLQAGPRDARDEQAEDDDRQHDHQLGARKKYTGRADRGPRRHRAHEGHGEQPAPTSGMLRRQKADRDHRNEVIPTQPGMRQSGRAIHRQHFIRVSLHHRRKDQCKCTSRTQT